MTRYVVIAVAVVAASAAASISRAAPPALDASPRQLQFGVQPINTQTSLTVTITNTSTQSIQFIGGIIAAQRHHTVNPFDWDIPRIDLNTCVQIVNSLPPGGTCTAPLTFTPAEPGNYHGRFIINYLLPGSDAQHEFSVPLSGRGISS